jgi:hypothetical protein
MGRHQFLMQLVDPRHQGFGILTKPADLLVSIGESRLSVVEHLLHPICEREPLFDDTLAERFIRAPECV